MFGTPFFREEVEICAPNLPIFSTFGLHFSFGMRLWQGYDLGVAPNGTDLSKNTCHVDIALR
ncbi:MAG: hypothetical protein ACOYNF_04550, partial [Rhodoferax sp.]